MSDERPVFHVKGWDEIYENHESRKIKNLTRVQIPNDTSSTGLSILLSQKNGLSHLGVWLLILEVASQGPKEHRGKLLRSDGRPHTPQSLAAKLRVQVAPIKEAWVALSSPEIGWLVSNGMSNVPGESPGNIPTPPGIPGESPGDLPDRPGNIPGCPDRRGGEGIGGDTDSINPDGLKDSVKKPSAFDRFWQTYPLKVGKGAAKKAWAKACRGRGDEKLLGLCLEALAWMIPSKAWDGGTGRFVPHASTWLNQERWTDDPAAYERNSDSKPTAKDDGPMYPGYGKLV